jgi:hypothetical protein
MSTMMNGWELAKRSKYVVTQQITATEKEFVWSLSSMSVARFVLDSLVLVLDTSISPFYPNFFIVLFYRSYRYQVL